MTHLIRRPLAALLRRPHWDRLGGYVGQRRRTEPDPQPIQVFEPVRLCRPCGGVTACPHNPAPTYDPGVARPRAVSVPTKVWVREERS